MFMNTETVVGFIVHRGRRGEERTGLAPTPKNFVVFYSLSVRMFAADTVPDWKLQARQEAHSRRRQSCQGEEQEPPPVRNIKDMQRKCIIYCCVYFAINNKIRSTGRIHAQLSIHTLLKSHVGICQITVWMTVAQNQDPKGRNCPTSTSFGSVPLLPTSEIGRLVLQCTCALSCAKIFTGQR
jgi:hypothetical protein